MSKIMMEVNYKSGKVSQTIFKSDMNISMAEVWNVLESKGLLKEHFYIIFNGRIVQDNENIITGSATLVPKLPGGKGGFGSMLRAIGAQIEKTTNREACRDLSGRRLRDINEEKRLKTWIEKQGAREVEAIECKKRKLKRLCAEPKHTFEDKSYEHERSVLTERIDDAVEQGFKNAAANNVKEKINDTKKGKKRKTILDDMDSDASCSSDSDTSDVTTCKKKIKSNDNHLLSVDVNCSNSADEREEKSNKEENSNSELNT